MIRINTAIKESTLARPQADLAESTSGGDGGRSPTITDGTPSVWNFCDFRRASVCRAGSVSQPRRSRRPRPTTRVLSAFVRESGQRRTPGVVDGGEADARAQMLPVGFVAKQSIRLWIDPMNQTAAAALTHCAKCLATPCDCSETGGQRPRFFSRLAALRERAPRPSRLHDLAKPPLGPLMSAAQANGWINSTAALPTANFATMAVTPVGSYYRPALSDPLFDI